MTQNKSLVEQRFDSVMGWILYALVTIFLLVLSAGLAVTGIGLPLAFVTILLMVKWLAFPFSKDGQPVLVRNDVEGCPYD